MLLGRPAARPCPAWAAASAGWSWPRFWASRRRGPSHHRPARAVFDVRPRPSHHPARAKAVIQLFMHGGPSHVDLFDPKPMLTKHDGQPPPKEVADDEKLTGNLLKSPYRFARHGGSGLEFSETLPHIARHADELAMVRSMFTMHRNHEQAIWAMHTGMTIAGRPTLPAWVAYGLGTENQELPAYVVLPDLEGPAGRRHPQLVERLAPPRVPGHAVPRRGDAGVEPQAAHPSPRRRRARPARAALATQRRTPVPPPRGARARRPHRQLRARRADAALGHRRTRPVAGIAEDADALRPRQPGHPLLRHPLPDGPAAGRAGRPVCPALHGRPALGHPRQQRRRHPLLLRTDRPADRRVCSPT